MVIACIREARISGVKKTAQIVLELLSILMQLRIESKYVMYPKILPLRYNTFLGLVLMSCQKQTNCDSLV